MVNTASARAGACAVSKPANATLDRTSQWVVRETIFPPLRIDAVDRKRLPALVKSHYIVYILAEFMGGITTG